MGGIDRKPMKFFYERIQTKKIDGEHTDIVIQQDEITKAEADSRRKTLTLPAQVFERIHIHNHNEPTDRNKSCIRKELRD